MNKLWALWITIFLSCSLFYSCYDEQNTFGDKLISSTFRNVTSDTCTVSVTNVLMDSVETTGKSLYLLGHYTNERWGTSTAMAYLPYSHPTYGTDRDKTVKLDSIVLHLKMTGYSVGDTTQVQHFTVHRLLEKIQLNSESSKLYSTSSFKYDPTPIGEVTFKPRPHRVDTVEIRLPDELGNDMLDKLHRRADAVNIDHWEDYFKGLVVVPDKSVCKSIQAFAVSDTASAIILHYHVADETDNAQECYINVNTSKSFYHIDHDRSNSLLSKYTAKKNLEIPSSDLGNLGFLFAGIGWYSRLEFPTLNSIMQQGSEVKIQSAYLRIYPLPDSYGDFNQLPDSVYLYIADENNVVTQAVTDYLGKEVQSATLLKDLQNKTNTCYTFDISNFISSEMGTFGMYKHNLHLVFDSDTYTKSFKNITFYNSRGNREGKYGVKLIVTYKIYDGN